jgi:hypothetical protein
MCNGYVVDLIVIELRIAMRENVAEPYDVSGVKNRFRNGGCHSGTWDEFYATARKSKSA